MLRQVGWARLQEIREYIAFFRQSGKFSMAFLTTGAEKEYYLASACEVSAAHVYSLLISVRLLFGRQLLACSSACSSSVTLLRCCAHRRCMCPRLAT